MTRYVGIDLHKHLIVGHVVDPTGKKVDAFRFERVDPVTLEYIGRTRLKPEDQVVLEATTNCWAVVRALEPFAARVTVSNPMATKAIAKAKVKTDKIDAAVLAHLLRLGYLPEVWQPDQTTQVLREWTARRSRIIGQRTAVINRLRSTLAQRLLHCPHDMTSQAARDWIAGQTVDDDTRWLLESDLRLMDSLQAELDAMDKLLAKRGYVDPRVKLLMTLPGVSRQTAQALLAAIGDVSRFPDADSLASYLGLVPSTRQSASHCYHGHITKQGRCHTRCMLIQSAHAVRNHPGPLGYFFRRLSKRKPYNVAAVAVAHKLVLLAWHVLTKGEPYRYAVPQATEKKLRKLRIQATGERRRSGLAPGTKRPVNVPKGSQKIKSLPEVYASEQVPPARPAPAGELRHLRAVKLNDFAAGLQQPQIVARGRKQEEGDIE
ncbi:MAG: IS110 family transposase [Planctomycetia bacterium]|nr:IS110 family transposase [Planctomycetia bacterium]